MFTKLKRTGVAAPQVDADGIAVTVEVREDSEQAVKLDETVDLLLAAGYFRARIKGLSPFDKVVGGMTWAIMACNEDVDVDLLFQENSTIGQKIALTEKIVAALPRLKCPHRLEPHQIQGLDFIHIFPVIQWLVKRALETRDEMTHEIRNRALLVFGKSGETPTDAAFRGSAVPATAAISVVCEAYKPRRQFKAPTTAGASEQTRVHSTLLELVAYGRRYGLSRPTKKKKDKSDVAKQLEGGEAGEEDDEAVAARKEEQGVRALLKSMASADEGSISAAALGSIVNMQAARIAELSDEYAAQQALLHQGDTEKAGAIAAHKRAVHRLQKQIETKTKRIAGAQEQHAAAEGEHAVAQEAAAAAALYSKRLTKELAKLDALEGDAANQDVLRTLRGLITLNETLKAQEEQFRATCKAEMAAWQGKIAALQGEGVEVLDDSAGAQAIQEKLAAEQKRLQRLRLLAARRNREIATLQRQIDEVPSRLELTQYQKRFVELYEQVAAKYRETKRFYTLYNTLDDTKVYLAKEEALLTSIHANFERAMASASGKEQFSAQLTQIVQSVAGNKSKVEERLGKERGERDRLRAAFLDLVDRERTYHKTVKDYEMECAKNEQLLAKSKRRAH